MHPNRPTQLLLLLVAVALLVSLIAWNFLSTNCEAAEMSRRNLLICNTELAAMTIESSPKRLVNDDAAINRQLRSAAMAARLSDQLASIDPGPAARIGQSDFTQTPLYIRLNAVAFQQLVGFLYELSITDQSLRTTDIDLSLPLNITPHRADSSDLWTADVTLSYLEYAQRQPQPPESR